MGWQAGSVLRYKNPTRLSMNKTTSTLSLVIKAVMLIFSTVLVGSITMAFLILGVLYAFG